MDVSRASRYTLTYLLGNFGPYEKSNLWCFYGVCFEFAVKATAETMGSLPQNGVLNLKQLPRHGDLFRVPNMKMVIKNHMVHNRSRRLHIFAEMKMGSYGAILKKAGDIHTTGLQVKTMAVKNVEQQMAPQKHWDVCHRLLNMLACRNNFLPAILNLIPTQIRQPVSILILVLQTLDNFEDDTGIPENTKIPFLRTFHQQIHDPDWNFPCGTTVLEDLTSQFHHVRSAFQDLEKSHQEVIVETAREVGAGMANFISKEVDTIDDFHEYAHHVAVLPFTGFLKLVHLAGLGDLPPRNHIYAMGVILQKVDTIYDYLEDINSLPKPRLFWPRQIWSKYASNLEDLKYKENSVKALQCLNDMVTDALIHVEDCLKYLSTVQDPFLFRFFAIGEVSAIRMLALCYNNIEVFRGPIKLQSAVTLRIYNQTNTMSAVYGAFFKYTSLLKSKVKNDDPNAIETLRRLEAIQKICKDSGNKL